uniref:Transmembrane protein 106A n=1 Tax=Labrus bergylta TaxID=56723 RepID=A0A3Q3EV48_9LABR
MVSLGNSNNHAEGADLKNGSERARTLKHFPPYGTMSGNSSADTCPTCRGTGRIPRGHADQLVAVIPCNDVRLKPRRTKLYVCTSMLVCLLLSCLILYFLFPRSVTVTPVSVLSVMVYFNPGTIQMEVTNLINITNENFVPVQLVEFDIQCLISEVVVGKTKISNMTSIPSRSQKSRLLQVDLDPYSHVVSGAAVSIHLSLNISNLQRPECITLCREGLKVLSSKVISFNLTCS